MYNEESIVDSGVFSLEIGNHDSLFLWGTEEQTRLSEYSKQLSNLVSYTDDNYDDIVIEVVNSIENTKNLSNNKLFFFKRKNSILWKKKYNVIFEKIDEILLIFQMQQAQLLKDIRVIELLSDSFAKCKENLKNCIDEAKNIISNKENDMDRRNNSSDIANWYNRLERKLYDLEISYTIAEQNLLQLKIMKDNNNELIDKIRMASLGTIPIWRNQVSMLLGMEKIEQSVIVQNKLTSVLEKEVKKTKNVIKQKEKVLDVDAINKQNETVIKLLNELTSLQRDEKRIKAEICKNIQ